MSIRPYRDIARRKSRQIMVGKVPVGGDAPITVQTMTNTLTTDVDGHHRPDPPHARRPASTSSASPAPTRNHRGAEGDRPSGRTCRSSPTSISTTSARIEAAQGRRGLPAHQSGQYRLRTSGCSEVIKAAQRPRLLDAHRRQCRLAGEATCWKNTASPAPKRWSKARCTTPASCRTTTSTSSRSA